MILLFCSYHGIQIQHGQLSQKFLSYRAPTGTKEMSIGELLVTTTLILKLLGQFSFNTILKVNSPMYKCIVVFKPSHIVVLIPPHTPGQEASRGALRPQGLSASSVFKIVMYNTICTINPCVLISRTISICTQTIDILCHRWIYPPNVLMATAEGPPTGKGYGNLEHSVLIFDRTSTGFWKGTENQDAALMIKQSSG